MDLFDFMAQDQHPDRYIEPLDWMKTVRMELVTVATLPRVIDECIAAKVYAWDVECTGLDNRVFHGQTVDKLVGFCMSPHPDIGYYIPIAHQAGSEHNIPRSKLEPEILRLCASGALAIFHNSGFDQEFLEYNGGAPYAPEGGWDKASTFEDTLLMAYCLDSKAKQRGLKYLANLECGIKMYELKDLFPPKWNKGLNYSLLDPSDPGPLRYGCSDGIATLRLYNVLKERIAGPPDVSNIYNIEKACVASVRWMHRNRIPLSMDKVLELISVANHDLLKILDKAYTVASDRLGRDVRPGYIKWISAHFDPECGTPLTEWKDEAKALSKRSMPDPTGVVVDAQGIERAPVYDLFSPEQLGGLLDELQVPGLTRTEKSGQIKTSADALDKVFEQAERQFPWLRDISTFRQVLTTLGTFLVPIKKGLERTDGRVRINFKQTGTDSGRFSTPVPRVVMDGWPAWNMQATPATYDDPENPRPKSMTRIREVIEAMEGYFIVCIDFSGEELRVVTNISGEPVWINAFFSCIDCGFTAEMGDPAHWPPPPPPSKCPKCGGKFGDLHSATGDAIFPGKRQTMEYHEWAAVRQTCKVVNFQCLYGGGGGTVSRSTGFDMNESWRIVRLFEAKYKGLVNWWNWSKDFGRTNGYILTPFGRKYPVPDLQLPVDMVEGKDKNSFFRQKAEKNAINGPIQGAGADIIKIAMALVYRRLKKDGVLNEVRMIATMHDELVFEIKGEYLQKYIPILVDTMTNNALIRKRKWPVPFTSDVEIGHNYAVPWDYGKLSAKGVWPEPLAPFFTAETPTAPVAAQAPDALPTLERATVATVEAPPPVETPAPIPTDVENGVYTFHLLLQLTSESAHRLAEVIYKCKDSGTQRLQIKDRAGVILEGWEDHIPDHDGSPIMVNNQRFQILAMDAGL